jgi:hypothetical protein
MAIDELALSFCPVFADHLVELFERPDDTRGFECVSGAPGQSDRISSVFIWLLILLFF